MIVNFDWFQRETKKINRLLKQATIKYLVANIDSSIYESERLRTAKYIMCMMEST